MSATRCSEDLGNTTRRSGKLCEAGAGGGAPGGGNHPIAETPQAPRRSAARLENPRIFGAKVEEERALRGKVEANPEWQRGYGDAWTKIDAVYQELPQKAPRLAFSSLTTSRLGGYASTLVRYAEEITKPNEKRLEEFRDSRLESLRLSILSNAPVYPAMEEAILAAWLEGARATLEPTTRSSKRRSRTGPRSTWRERQSRPRADDPTARRALLEGAPEAIRRSTDPLIALARRVEPVIRELRDWQDNRLRSAETSAGQRIAAARFAVYGKTLYPDATFTLRLGFGRALGYEEDTTLVPWKTTFYGLFDRAESFGEKPPYDLSERWKSRRDRLNLPRLSTSCIPSTRSAAIREARSSTATANWSASISTATSRSCPTATLHRRSRRQPRHWRAQRGILEALTKIYDAQGLVDELLRR